VLDLGRVEIGVHLTTVGSQGEADVICGMLRAAGISCADREASGTWTGSMASGIWREILVPEADLEVAQTLLADAQSANERTR
jgi:Putative prokaryotic signal transducing protein